jgi:hypothetical protein
VTNDGGRPTIAAVVVNYNYARYLPEAVESLLGQSVPFDEIVVVNDGSTDDSMAVLEAYREAVTVLDIQNGGQLGACIAGIAATSSEYVYFLDADDYVRADLVESLRPAMLGRPVKIQFQLTAVSPTVDLSGAAFPEFPEGYDSTRMRADNRSIGFYICPPTSGNVYLRKTLADLSFDHLDKRDFIDGPVTLAMPYIGDVATVTLPLAFYRMHGSNHSGHNEPSSGKLEAEVDWFERRWRQTCGLIGLSAPPFVGDRPLYVTERQLMISALGNRRDTAVIAARFIRRLLTTNVPAARKGMMVGWALAIAVPVRRLRVELVRARLSPLTRSGPAARLVAALGRARRVSVPQRRQYTILRLGSRDVDAESFWLASPWVSRIVCLRSATNSGLRLGSRVLGIGLDSCALALKSLLSTRGPYIAANPWIGVALSLTLRKDFVVTGLYARPGTRSWKVLRFFLRDKLVLTTAEAETESWCSEGGRARSVLFGQTFGYPASRFRGDGVLRIFVGGTSDRDHSLVERLEEEVRAADIAVELRILNGSAGATATDGTCTVVRPGRVSPDRFGVILSECDVVVLPLRENGRAAGHMVAVGALESGVPVVSTKVVGMTGYLDATGMSVLETHERLLPQLAPYLDYPDACRAGIREAWSRRFSAEAYVSRFVDAIVSSGPDRR